MESKINEFDFNFAKKLKINRGVFSENVNREITKNKNEIKLTYDSKMKLNAKKI